MSTQDRPDQDAATSPSAVDRRLAEVADQVAASAATLRALAGVAGTDTDAEPSASGVSLVERVEAVPVLHRARHEWTGDDATLSSGQRALARIVDVLVDEFNALDGPEQSAIASVLAAVAHDTVTAERHGLAILAAAGKGTRDRPSASGSSPRPGRGSKLT